MRLCKCDFQEFYLGRELTDLEQNCALYGQFERLYLRAAKQIIMGDFNAEVGKEQGFVGKHHLNEKTKDNGWRRIDFATARIMAVSSTLFKPESVHSQT
jgi:hypothetical protein